MTFMPFELLFGVASLLLGIFRAWWMAVGVTLLASALLFTVDVDRNFKDSITADAPPSNRGFFQN